MMLTRHAGPPAATAGSGRALAATTASAARIPPQPSVASKLCRRRRTTVYVPAATAGTAAGIRSNPDPTPWNS
jgi:hypothetical protein